LRTEFIADCYFILTPSPPFPPTQVEWYTTLSKACYSCGTRDSDCLRVHCIPADGRKKPIVTVNRRLPGPTVQVRTENNSDIGIVSLV